jgi:xylose isomerase
MRITRNLLAKLESEYRGYLEGLRLDEFLEEFGVKFAAGHWAAGGFSDRFAPGGYFPDLNDDIISQIKRVHGAGIKGVEFHDFVFKGRTSDEVESEAMRIRSTLKELKLIPTNMNINLWTESKWKMGGFTNPKKATRKQAIEVALRAVDLAKRIGCESVSLWPGSDGWDYNFEVDYGQQLDRFINGLIVLNKTAKKAGLKVGTEAKLHEPREGNMVLPTTHYAALVAMEVNSACGGTNLGVAIDYGHEQMYACEPAATVYAVKRFGVPLVNFHVNTAKLHSNDEDRVTGTGDIWRMVDFIYAAIDTGYDGWFGEDQFTYRMEPIKGMSLSRELFGNLFKKALLIYSRRKELSAARNKGDQGAVIDAVKRIIYTG